MSDPENDALRERMVADITVHTVLQTGRLGKAALSRRVMEAMGRYRGTPSCATSCSTWPMPTRLCPATAARRSRSRSSWR
ncbi:MAG: hypothetical protein U1F49_16040 [Rubrivivax sp.]